jgi:nickel-dependent lactate racemase
MSYTIPYGREQINFKIPSGIKIDSLIPKNTKQITSIYKKTLEAILSPINSPSLLELVKEKKSVCIVVTDISRECPDKELLVPILEVIEKTIDRVNITILIASGMHKKMSYEEKVEKYGKKISDTYRIIDHNAKDETSLISLGITKNGTPVKISKIVVESDFVISLGVVEPHQFAGYSGGYKTVSIGLAGDETISYTHSSQMLKKSNARVGKINDNLIQDEIIEIGKKTGLDFLVNVILDMDKKVIEIEAGEPIETHRSLISKAKQLFEISIKKPYNVVLCGVGYPRDSNLYQTTRAASYLFFAKKPVIQEGGYIIIPAKCEDGYGKGIGEQRFFSMLKNNTIDEILNKTKPFKAGEQRAFFVANVLKKCKIIIVGSSNSEIISDGKMIPAKNMAQALDLVQKQLGNNIEILLIPNALSMLPIIE